MDFQCVTCPQLLSEDVLRGILNDVGIFERCIDIPNIKSMDKTKLIEIFKRVALPMPQRIYNEERLLGRRMQNLRLSRNIAIANHDEIINSRTANTELSETDAKFLESANNRSSCNDRLKRSINDTKPLQKKIRLSITDESEIDMDKSHDIKRKCETLTQIDSKKRQKITWP